MIVAIHCLYFLLKFGVKLYKIRQCMKRFSEARSFLDSGSFSNESDLEKNITFDPPVYRQRYAAVQRVLLDPKWRTNIKKLVDFGCAEFGLFMFLKRLFGLEEILAVDIDAELLKDNVYKVRPLTVDYLNRRTEPLRINVLAGSIADPDKRLLGCDAVICVEIIEHLYPDTLEALPYNIFAFIKPQVAVFTTPNADFNVNFPNFSGFRHYDHKFEWNRQQFESWANNIAVRFPQYTVQFEGIGTGPRGTEYLGCCSQMAIFVRNDSNSQIQGELTGCPSNVCCAKDVSHLQEFVCPSHQNGVICLCTKHISLKSYGICTYHSWSKLHLSQDIPKTFTYVYNGMGDGPSPVELDDYYISIEQVNFPFEIDDRTHEEKILDEIKYKIHRLGHVNGRFYNDDKNRAEIPIVELLSNEHTHFIIEDEIQQILAKAGYKIEECTYGVPEICVIFEPEMESNNSTPNESNFDSEYKSKWPTIDGNQSLSDWDVDSDEHKWTNKKAEAQLHAQEIVSDIVSNVDGAASSVYSQLGLGNVPKSIISNATKSPDGNQEQANILYDSGYQKSVTNPEGSPISSEFDDIFDDHFMSCTSLEDDADKVHESAFLNCNHTPDTKTISSQTKNVAPKINVDSSKDACIESCGSTQQPQQIDLCVNIPEVTSITDENIKCNPEESTKSVSQECSELSKANHVEVTSVGFPNENRLCTQIKRDLKIDVATTISSTYKKNLKDCTKEPVAGTSNIKKKKKGKKSDSDKESAEDLKSGHQPSENKVIVQCDRAVEQIEPVLVDDGVAVILVVENGDLANNNRDFEGNNYPDAPQIVEAELLGGANDNENLGIHNNLEAPVEVNRRNEDIENRNDHAAEEEHNNEVEEAVANIEPVQKQKELEIEHASREVLFDPNSQVDMLEEYDLPAPEEVIEANNQIGNLPQLPNVIFIGVHNENDGGALLPAIVEPFPNWLLQLLGADVAEDVDTHDEPHFFCQGDGIGVHPSVIEVDFEEEHSTSESSADSENDESSEPDVQESLEVDAQVNDQPIEVVGQRAAVEHPTAAQIAEVGSTSNTESLDDYYDTTENSSLVTNVPLEHDATQGNTENEKK